MENSKKPLRNSAFLTPITKGDTVTASSALQLQLEAFLAQHLQLAPACSTAKPPLLLLALSGGLDSVVLLHLLTQVKAVLPFTLQAMHVHHGLSPNADAWAEFCLAQCQQFNVPLHITHVQVAKNPDYKNSTQGIEAEARALRYNVLFHFRTSDTIPAFIVTAHHQDDQAETVLLQLFRGAGVKGLAAMAAIDQHRRLMRPLLNIPRNLLHQYAVQHQLHWCEDESNDNTQYDRNFVRHTLLPQLTSRFAGITTVLTRTASHMAEASALLETLAEQDAEAMLCDNSVCLKQLQTLDLSRIKNLLRWWFTQHALAMPSTEHLHEIVTQLLYARKDADINIKLQHLYLRKYQQRAYLCQDQPLIPFDLVWNGEAELDLPGGGKLCFSKVTGAGLALKHGITKLRITHRTGGERFKPDARRPTRTLKYLLQEMNMPPWKRITIPLVYWQDQLAYVPGVGATHTLLAQADEPGLEIIWQDASA